MNDAEPPRSRIAGEISAGIRLFPEGPLDANYETILGSFGTVLLQDGLGYYLGDCLVLYDRQTALDSYGFLVFGYGSCSGCDALEAASYSYETLDAEIDRLRASIVYFASLEELVRFLDDPPEISWWHAEGVDTHSFRNKVAGLAGLPLQNKDAETTS